MLKLLLNPGMHQQTHQANSKTGKPSGSDLRLWKDQASRIESHIFDSNLPTFLLGHDQRLLDFNDSFKLIFGGILEKNASIANWFQHLDNYKRVEKRHDMFFGDAILPMADRDRIVFVSDEFGRMVFTKIMSPIFDQKTARVIGWTVILNINSVSKRKKFFSALHECLEGKTNSRRFAASYDLIFDSISDASPADQLHLKNQKHSERILNFGCKAGNLSEKIAIQLKSKVHSLEFDPAFLRNLRMKKRNKRTQVALQDHSSVDLKVNYYDGVVIHDTVLNRDSLVEIYRSLKTGGHLTISFQSENSKNTLHEIKKQLTEEGRYDELKYAFNHFAKTYQSIHEEALSPTELLNTLKDVGFNLRETHETSRGLYKFIVLNKG